MSAPTGILRLLNAVWCLSVSNWNQPLNARTWRVATHSARGWFEFERHIDAIAFAARRGIRIVEER